MTGLNDEPEVLAFHGLLYGTPSLVARLYAHLERDENALAEALGGTAPALPDRLAAGQITAVRRVLAQENWRRITDGAEASALLPEAMAAAASAFARLEAGLPGLARPTRGETR